MSVARDDGVYLPGVRDLIEAACADLDPKTATALRKAMMSTFRLGAAMMRNQILTRLSEGHQSLELGICDISLDGLLEH
jgi:hypothetical protein